MSRSVRRITFRLKIRGFLAMKRTDVWQSFEVFSLKKRVIAGVGLVLLAILVGGTFIVVPLFKQHFQANQPLSQHTHPRVYKLESYDRIPSTEAIQAATTVNPWGITFDTLRGIVWVAEPGCEALPCSSIIPGNISEYDQLDGSLIQDFTEPPGYSSPLFVAIDSNGNVWFTQPNSDAIGELHPQNTNWSQWPLQKGSVPYDLTFDTYGNLWFTEFNANKIGFFNPQTHKLVENTIPTPDSNPYGITRDPRGNIWFTENRAGVGQIGSFTPTPSGTVTIVEHAVATAQPHLITSDKAGNIWYSEAFAGGIGSFNPASGTSTNYSVSADACTNPTTCKGTHISGLSIDQKGNVWFDDSLSNRVGYLVPPTGQVVARTLTTINAHPYDGLAVDSYNDVWFTELYGSLLVMWPRGTVK